MFDPFWDPFWIHTAAMTNPGAQVSDGPGGRRPGDCPSAGTGGRTLDADRKLGGADPRLGLVKPSQ